MQRKFINGIVIDSKRRTDSYAFTFDTQDIRGWDLLEELRVQLKKWNRFCAPSYLVGDIDVKFRLGEKNPFRSKYAGDRFARIKPEYSKHADVYFYLKSPLIRKWILADAIQDDNVFKL